MTSPTGEQVWILAGGLLQTASEADRRWVEKLFDTIAVAGDDLELIPSLLGDYLDVLLKMGARYGIPWDVETTEADRVAILNAVHSA